MHVTGNKTQDHVFSNTCHCLLKIYYDEYLYYHHLYGLFRHIIMKNVCLSG